MVGAQMRILIFVFLMFTALLAQSEPQNVFDLGAAIRAGDEIRQAEELHALRIDAAKIQLQRDRMRMQAETELLQEQREAIAGQSRSEQRVEPQYSTPTLPPNYSDRLLGTFLARIKYRRYRWTDFDEVVFAEELQLSDDMVALMNESRYTADIVYYLGNNPEVSSTISKMPLPKAGRAIYEIEELIISEGEIQE